MFNEHGGFDLKREKDILLVDVTGAWNAETAKAYREAIVKIMVPAKDKPWALISNVEQWELCTPDCKLLIVELTKHCRDNGLKREAVVNSNTASVKLDLFHKNMKKQTSKASPDVFERDFFETEKEAREWLKNEGYGLK